MDSKSCPLWSSRASLRTPWCIFCLCQELRAQTCRGPSCSLPSPLHPWTWATICFLFWALQGVKWGRQAPKRRWQLTWALSPWLRQGEPRQWPVWECCLSRQSVAVWACMEHLPGKRSVPSGTLPEGVLSLTRSVSQINGSFLVSCQLLLELPESLNHAVERGRPPPPLAASWFLCPLTAPQPPPPPQ